MEKIPTAEEWLLNHKEMSKYDVEDYDEGGYLGVNENALYKIMIEFAKLHVEQALKEASKKAQIKYEYSGNVGEYCDEFVDVNSILNSYPLENIK